MNPPAAATRPLIRRRIGLLATLAVAAVLALVLPQGASAAGPTMSPDTVVAVADPGVTLAVPEDGRVNGYQFTARVLGAATGTAMPSPSGARAGAGQRLWVFGLRWFADQLLDNSGQFQGVAQVTATLIYDQARLVVPVQQPPNPPDGTTGPVDSGDQYFVASLPANTNNVQLELANGGFAQDFSLTHMTRQGTQPAVLYRNPDSWQTVQPFTLSKSLATPYTQSANVDTSNLLGASITLQLSGVTLSYFAPDGPTDNPTDPAQAWLIPDLQDPVPSFHSAFENLNYTTHAQASGITLTLPDGMVIDAKAFPGTGPDNTTYSGDDNNTVFPDGFAFQVPANFTTGTVNVALPAEVAYPDYGFTAPSQTYNLPPVHFPVTLPAPPSVTPTAGASDHPALIRAIRSESSAGNAGGGGSGGAGFPWWAIVVILLAAGTAGGVLVSRRGRRTSTQPAQSAGSTAAPEQPPPAATAGFVVRPPDVGETAGTAPAATATIAPPMPTDGHEAIIDDPGSPDRPSVVWAVEETNGQPPMLDEPVIIDTSHQPAGSTAGETGSGMGLFDLAGSDPLEGFTPPEPPPMSQRALYVFDNMAFRDWAEPPDRNPVIDIVVYLAAHPGRPVSSETLRTILGSEAADPVRNTLRSNISRARKALGEGYLPEAAAGTYQLIGVDCDLTAMEDLAAQAAAAERSGQSDEAVRLYGQAVALITGRPFRSERDYTWVDQEDLRTHAERVAARTAHALARLALSTDRSQLALWAARQGTHADPIDQTLAAAAITAAKRSHTPGALRAEWTAITRRLDAHNVEIDPELADLYRRLLQEPDD